MFNNASRVALCSFRCLDKDSSKAKEFGGEFNPTDAWDQLPIASLPIEYLERIQEGVVLETSWEKCRFTLGQGLFARVGWLASPNLTNCYPQNLLSLLSRLALLCLPKVSAAAPAPGHHNFVFTKKNTKNNKKKGLQPSPPQLRLAQPCAPWIDPMHATFFALLVTGATRDSTGEWRRTES